MLWLSATREHRSIQGESDAAMLAIGRVSTLYEFTFGEKCESEASLNACLAYAEQLAEAHTDCKTGVAINPELECPAYPTIESWTPPRHGASTDWVPDAIADTDAVLYKNGKTRQKREAHMPDPKRALTICHVRLRDKELPPDTLIWVHGESDQYWEVEYQDRRGKIPRNAAVPYPVKGPSLAKLKRLDSCFGLEDDAFVLEHLSKESYYEILRCRAHGRRFLRDTRGGIGMYTVLTLLEDDEEGSPDDIWARYHWKSDSWLSLEGRTL